MRLDTFLLADAVAAPPDGKLYLHGAGISKLTVPMLPFAVSLAVIVRLEVTESEVTAEHEYRFDWLDPTGVMFQPTHSFVAGVSGPGSRPPEVAEGEEQFINLALNFGGVGFGRAGVHRIDFSVDGETLRSVSLPVVALLPEEVAELQVQPHAPQKPASAASPVVPNRAARRQQQRGQR